MQPCGMIGPLARRIVDVIGWLFKRESWKFLLPEEKAKLLQEHALKERLDSGNQVFTALDFHHTYHNNQMSVLDFIG